VRIPIERAMDLLVQRGLPVHSQSASGAGPASKAGTSKSQAEGNQGETQ
jgi:hypothetical protein